MQFIITKQIAVEAETPEEAVSKISDGNTISLSVNARPQPGQMTTGMSPAGRVITSGFQQTTTPNG